MIFLFLLLFCSPLLFFMLVTAVLPFAFVNAGIKAFDERQRRAHAELSKKERLVRVEAERVRRAEEHTAREAAFAAAMDAQARDRAEFEAASPEQRPVIIQQRRAEREAANKAAEAARWEAIKAEQAARLSQARAA